MVRARYEDASLVGREWVERKGSNLSEGGIRQDERDKRPLYPALVEVLIATSEAGKVLHTHSVSRT